MYRVLLCLDTLNFADGKHSMQDRQKQTNIKKKKNNQKLIKNYKN